MLPVTADIPDTGIERSHSGLYVLTSRISTMVPGCILLLLNGVAPLKSWPCDRIDPDSYGRTIE